MISFTVNEIATLGDKKAEERITKAGSIWSHKYIAQRNQTDQAETRGLANVDAYLGDSWSN